MSAPGGWAAALAGGDAEDQLVEGLAAEDVDVVAGVGTTWVGS